MEKIRKEIKGILFMVLATLIVIIGTGTMKLLADAPAWQSITVFLSSAAFGLSCFFYGIFKICS